MTYRKFKASQLFTGTEMLGDDVVLITKNDGTIEAIVNCSEGGEDIQQLNGILCPGFINTHCHLELSHMKGLIPEHTGLVDFVLQVVTQRHFPEDAILEAIAKAEDDMLSAGIVAVGDICNNTLTISQKKLNRLRYHSFIEVSGWNPLVASARLEKSLEYYQAFQQVFPHHTSLSPHAPYSVSPDLWNRLLPFFVDQILTIHNQESEAENELFQKGTGDFMRLYTTMEISNPSFKATGTNSLATFIPYMQKSKQLILVHNSFIQQQDIDLILQKNKPVSFCLCPNANLYIENTLPPVDLLLHNQLDICIGTDSLASNHQLSILEEMKTLGLHFPHLTPDVLLKAATLNGAKALGMDDELGSFEKGKKPGVLLLNGFTAVSRLL